MMRFSTNGPRSVMRTVVLFPLFTFVTRTIVSNGSVRCAAVSLYISYISPLEARRPLNGSPYHDAFPSSVYPARAGATIGRSRFGAPAGRPAGVSGTSVERFADSSAPGGVAVGCVGGRLAIGLRPAHPDPISARK